MKRGSRASFAIPSTTRTTAISTIPPSSTEATCRSRFPRPDTARLWLSG